MWGRLRESDLKTILVAVQMVGCDRGLADGGGSGCNGFVLTALLYNACIQISCNVMFSRFPTEKQMHRLHQTCFW